MGAPPLFFDLTGRGAVVLTGKDRVSFLHGIVSNDVKALKPGGGCAAAFLTPKGKLLADCVVLCEEDRLEIDCEPELAGKIDALLRKYLVFNEVLVSNATGETAVFHLRHSAAGDAVEDFLRKVMGRDPSDAGPGGALPLLAHAHVSAQRIRIVRENRTGVPGYDVRCPFPLSEEIRKGLISAGAREATGAELDSLRIQAGIPRWGFELTEDVLPDEAGLRERGFISDTKGCYVGQETVARIRTYGHVNRKLVSLEVEGDAPAIGTEILFEEEAAGAVTSAARDAGSDRVSVLGYVRRERAAPGTPLRLRSAGRDRTATVSPHPRP